MTVGSGPAVQWLSTLSEVFVPYTIASRGRPIGTTELDFVRLDGSTRSGWFVPNTLGETLMPTIALGLPAMCAFVNRNAKGEDGQGIVRPSFCGSSLFADLAEALDRVATLELTLHRQDGTLVPTETVGIQDTERLLSLINWTDLWEECDRLVETEVDDVDSSLYLDGEWQEFGDDDFEITSGEDWLPDPEPDPNQRYQVHILLSQENAIP
jgi:hypothetical protein